MDPLAGMYTPFSPYNYVLGNPISNTDPDGRSVDTDIVDKDGVLIARVDDSTPDHVAVVDGSASKIQQKLANGDVTTEQLISGAKIKTTATNIRAAAQVLDRTENNGGDYEEASLVEGGVISTGERGAQESATVPGRSGINGVSIHSHGLNATEDPGGGVRSYSALKPSLTGQKPAGEADQDAFPNFLQNIIVGRLGNASKTSSGISQPKLGAAFYGRGEVKPQGTLTKSAMQQILKNRIKPEAGF